MAIIINYKSKLHNLFTSEFNQSEKFGSNMGQKAHTTAERNWQESQCMIRRLGVILLNCSNRREGSVEYPMALLQSDRLYFLQHAIEIQTDHCSSLKVHQNSLSVNSPPCNTLYNRLDVMVVPDWSVALHQR